MPSPHEHARQRPALERMLAHVPGFAGYLEKENRRDSDRLQREWLADRLERSQRGLDSYARRLADAGDIDTLPALDRLRGGIDALVGRIRGAMGGYSGFFDLVRIDEEVLERVYAHDADLVGQVGRLADDVAALATETQPPAQRIAPLEAELAALEEAWDEREDILKGLA